MRVGGIDPGARFFAWGMFTWGEDGFLLEGAGWHEFVSYRNTALFVEDLKFDQLTIEKPVIYAHKAKGDNNDLIDLALVVGACAAGCNGSMLATPARWKGQTKKDVCHARLREELSVNENAMLNALLREVPSKRRLDMLDAVAIAAWTCGRRV